MHCYCNVLFEICIRFRYNCWYLVDKRLVNYIIIYIERHLLLV